MAWAKGMGEGRREGGYEVSTTRLGSRGGGRYTEKVPCCASPAIGFCLMNQLPAMTPYAAGLTFPVSS